MKSSVIEAMRFPLAAMVVIIHSSMIGTDYAMPDWASMSGNDVFTAVNIFFSHVVCHVAVPVFFVISGYLLFFGVKKFDRQIYFGKLKKRSRFLVPYVLWNFSQTLLFFAVCILKQKPITQEVMTYNWGGYCGTVTSGRAVWRIGWEPPYTCPVQY